MPNKLSYTNVQTCTSYCFNACKLWTIFFYIEFIRFWL